LKSIDELRGDTPGVRRVAHFNNCGAALPPMAVVEAQIDHLLLERDVGGYEAAARNQAKRTLNGAASRLLGCAPEEIAFADSASRAWNLFVHSLMLRPGDEILTSRIDFSTNLDALRWLSERFGATVRTLPSRTDGTVDPDGLPHLLNRRTKLVAITHAAGHFGGVNPVEDIGGLLAGGDTLFLVDACQSAGQLPVDVAAMRCDALTVSGRKWLRGPRGTGFLYVRGQAARRFELWERNVAAEIGLATAIDYFLDIGVEAVRQRIARLAGSIVERLRAIPEISVLDASDGVRSGVVGLTIPGGERAVAAIREYLRRRGVNVSSMARQDVPLDCAARNVAAVLRIAPHYYNTEDEIDRLFEHLVAGLRA
jgi:cysteine desulfurase/selenocysteine lyase